MKKYTVIICLFFGAVLFAQNSTSNFEKPTISIGLLVSDMEASLAFYTGVIGMQETGGFPVDSVFAKKSGLSGGVPFKVKMLKLENNEAASEFKLVSFGNKTLGKEQVIQDQNRMRYMTIFVKSMAPILERAKKAGVSILSEPELTVRDGRQFVLLQDPDGVFVELIGNK